MSLSLVHNEVPPLEYPQIICDQPLHPKLDKIPLTRNMNKSFAALIAGIPGSGKTSLLMGLLKTKAYFNQVFNKIYLFMPKGSKNSIKDSIFDVLPDNQVFDDLSVGNLKQIWEDAEKLVNDQKEKKKKKRDKILVIFDDVQDKFKETKEMEDQLCTMFSRRRHVSISFFVLAQTYKKLSKPCRQMLTDIFAFNLSSMDFETIFEEHSKFPKLTQQQITNFYISRVNEETNKKENGEPYEHLFLYLNESNQKVFLNFDEVLVTLPNMENATLPHPPHQPGGPDQIERRSRKDKKRKSDQADLDSDQEGSSKRRPNL